MATENLANYLATQLWVQVLALTTLYSHFQPRKDVSPGCSGSGLEPLLPLPLLLLFWEVVLLGLEQDHSSRECHTSLHRMSTLCKDTPPSKQELRVPAKHNGLHLTSPSPLLSPGPSSLASFSLNLR